MCYKFKKCYENIFIFTEGKSRKMKSKNILNNNKKIIFSGLLIFMVSFLVVGINKEYKAVVCHLSESGEKNTIDIEISAEPAPIALNLSFRI